MIRFCAGLAFGILVTACTLITLATVHRFVD